MQVTLFQCNGISLLLLNRLAIQIWSYSIHSEISFYAISQAIHWLIQVPVFLSLFKEAIVVVGASAPRVYPRATLVSACTLSG